MNRRTGRFLPHHPFNLPVPAHVIVVTVGGPIVHQRLAMAVEGRSWDVDIRIIEDREAGVVVEAALSAGMSTYMGMFYGNGIFHAGDDLAWLESEGIA